MLNSLCAIRSGLIAVLLMSAMGTVVRAAVSSFDDITPIDILGTAANEGLPAGGNIYNINDPVGAQTRWEKNEDIIVGRFLPMGGRLDIDGNSDLRYQDLIIGDRGEFNGETYTGNGTVLITGDGSLYSNNPNSLPPNLPPGFGVAGAVARATDVGFDLYVGRWGVGTLELRGGGRAEIQDAVLVGDEQGSSGELVVDGFASLLASGGFDDVSGPVGGDPHQMIIGRHGFGRMTVSNGGRVVTEAPPATGDITVGAVIGSDVFNEDPPEPGGDGTVTVTGGTSKWVIGGSLQIGGYHDSLQGALEDFSGVNVEYNSEAGRGTLYVQNNAVVNIRPALGSDPTQDDLFLVIGRFGRLDLAGGMVTIGNPGTREDNTQLLNDGVITGSGRIETGVFRNRYVGEVRVNPGQSLIIDSTSEFINVAQDNAPLENFGVMRILGTVDSRSYLEFERAPDAPLDPIQPFRNKRVARPTGAPVADFFGGLISAQHSTLIFRSGLENTGMVAFTDGMNYVVGDVNNIGAPAVPLTERGIIRLIGPNTRGVFENDLLGTGILTIQGGATLEVLARHSFMTGGELTLDVDPSGPTPITTAGDVGIAGDLRINLVNVTPGSLFEGKTIPLISFGGEIGGIDFSDPFHPTIDLDAAPLFANTFITPSLASLGLAPGLVIIPEFTLNSVILAVRSTVGHIGPDFNGDGVVDALDLAIWKMNKGITMGGTVLQGDANGDGAVDGADYLIWLEAFTMGPGSGGGNFADFGDPAGPSGTVPEPTGLALVTIGGLLSLAFRRRRG